MKVTASTDKMMKKPPPDDYPPENGISLKQAITNLTQAIGELHQWYQRLSQLIEELDSTGEQEMKPLFRVDQHWSTTDLKQLQREVKRMLADLNREIDSIESPKAGPADMPLLIRHRYTLVHWCTSIKRALGNDPQTIT